MNVRRSYISYSKKCFTLHQVLTLFKIVVLLIIVVTGKAPRLSASQGERLISPLAVGWIVLSGKTQVKDPHVNFRHAFAGSSNNGHDVCTPIIL